MTSVFFCLNSKNLNKCLSFLLETDNYGNWIQYLNFCDTEEFIDSFVDALYSSVLQGNSPCISSAALRPHLFEQILEKLTVWARSCSVAESSAVYRFLSSILIEKQSCRKATALILECGFRALKSSQLQDLAARSISQGMLLMKLFRKEEDRWCYVYDLAEPSCILVSSDDLKKIMALLVLKSRHASVESEMIQDFFLTILDLVQSMFSKSDALMLKRYDVQLLSKYIVRNVQIILNSGASTSELKAIEKFLFLVNDASLFAEVTDLYASHGILSPSFMRRKN